MNLDLRPALLPLLLLGCAVENGFKTGGDAIGGDDTDEERDDTGGGGGGSECPGPVEDAIYVGMDESCASEPVVGTFTPVIEWRNTSIGDAYTTPVVGRIYDENDDGTIDENDVPAVVVATTSGSLAAVAGATGATLWKVGGLGSEPMTAAIGDLDGDGRPEVVGSGVGTTLALRGNGSTMWTGPGATNAYCGAVAIADLDGDSNPEVVLGNMILNGQTGALRGRGSYGSGSGYSGGGAAAMGVVADIDQDGVQEAVVGNALYDADGNAIWTNGQSDGFVAVANFDDDEYGEIVVTSTGMVRLQDDNGSVLWAGRYTGATSGPPTVADFDGDGAPEIGVAGNGQYIVIEADGSTLWSRATVDYSSGFTGSAVFDFEGDGAAEVVYADENDLYVFDGATGAVKLAESEHSSATCSEYPAVADVDNDGHAEIIYTSSAYSGSEQGVRVVGDADNSWQAGRPVWNEHAYSITNIEEDCSVSPTPETNWIAGYNNFRSGDITPVSGSGEPDLSVAILDVCEEDCDAGDITVWVAVSNLGTLDLDAEVLVTLSGTSETEDATELYSFTWTEALPAGWRGQAVEISLTGVPVPLGDLIATVNADGAVSECHTDNNQDSWGAPICL